jgi:hypothetical protein
MRAYGRGRNPTCTKVRTGLAIHAILPVMYPGATYHGSMAQARAVDDLVLVETRHAAHQAVARHAHAAPTLCLPIAGGFDELAGGTRLAVVSPSVLMRAAGEPHADRFGARDARCFNVVVGRGWLARHDLEAPPWRARPTGSRSARSARCASARSSSPACRASRPACR